MRLIVHAQLAAGLWTTAILLLLAATFLTHSPTPAWWGVAFAIGAATATSVYFIRRLDARQQFRMDALYDQYGRQGPSGVVKNG